MVEAFNQSFESEVGKATIPQISKAISDLFGGKDLKSKEMVNYIKEVYDLIDLIRNRAPQGMKSQLLRGPGTDAQFPKFIHDLKEQYVLEKNGDVTKEIFAKYEELFARGGEGCVKQWKEIVAHYNPDRLNQILN